MFWSQCTLWTRIEEGDLHSSMQMVGDRLLFVATGDAMSRSPPLIARTRGADAAGSSRDPPSKMHLHAKILPDLRFTLSDTIIILYLFLSSPYCVKLRKSAFVSISYNKQYQTQSVDSLIADRHRKQTSKISPPAYGRFVRFWLNTLHIVIVDTSKASKM